MREREPAPGHIARARVLVYDWGMTDLDPAPFRVKGRAAVPLVASVVRSIGEADLSALTVEKGSKAPALKRLAERHHALARCLASGMSQGDAAVTCGYSSSRVSILLDDPTFQNLLAFYREDTQRAYLDLHQRLAGIASDAAELLSDQLETDLATEPGERKVSIGQLVEIVKTGADRTGHGPQSTQLNVNVGIAARLEAARKRVAARDKMIEGECEDV